MRATFRYKLSIGLCLLFLFTNPLWAVQLPGVPVLPAEQDPLAQPQNPGVQPPLDGHPVPAPNSLDALERLRQVPTAEASSFMVRMGSAATGAYSSGCAEIGNLIDPRRVISVFNVFKYLR